MYANDYREKTPSLVILGHSHASPNRIMFSCALCRAPSAPLTHSLTYSLTHSSSLVVHSLLEKEEHMKPTPAYKAYSATTGGGDEERICERAEERKKEEGMEGE